METIIEIIQGATYIFQGKNANNHKTYRKYKLLEVTDHSYLIKNVDTKATFRQGIVDFNNTYKLVEIL